MALAQTPQSTQYGVEKTLMIADQQRPAFARHVLDAMHFKIEHQRGGRAANSFDAALRPSSVNRFELRASLALAKLYRAANRDAAAHAVLAPAVESFPPTRQFPELDEAQALLAALRLKIDCPNKPIMASAGFAISPASRPYPSDPPRYLL